MGVKAKSIDFEENVQPGWGNVGKSFKKAERNFIETGKLLFALGTEGLWVVMRHKPGGSVRLMRPMRRKSPGRRLSVPGLWPIGLRAVPVRQRFPYG